MKFLILSVVLMSGVAVAAEALPGGQVTLPYSEFRGLLESRQKTPDFEPPVPFAVLSTHLVLVPESSSAQGTVTFDIQSFSDLPQLVPLIGDIVTVRKVSPDGATVITKGGYYNLLVVGAKRQTVTLELGWPGRDGTFHCPIAPAVIAEVRISQLPEGVEADIEGAVRDEKSGLFHLGSRDSIAIHLRRPHDKPDGEVVPMPPVVAAADSEMRIVNDGTFITATTWRIRHNTAFGWKVNLGADTQVVSCLVDGHLAAPVLAADHSIEIRLPEKDRETQVELAYTGKTAAFAPVRGEFSVALPSTELLVERSDWKLVLPAAFAPVAVEGNTEFLPGESRNELRLRKELCRGEAPAARVFYQKPETTKKP